MIRRKDECKIEYREKMRDGNGTVRLTSLIAGPEELNNKGRLFSRITLKKFTLTTTTLFMLSRRYLIFRRKN